MKAGEFTKNYILNINKVINGNGCWIPNIRAQNTGYVQITINRQSFYLHRVVLCLWYDVNYYNREIETRHSRGCDKACFNPDHLQPGSAKDNIKDAVLFGEHHNASLILCPRCDGQYKISRVKSGIYRGKIIRVCNFCRNERVKAKRKKG